MRTLRFGGSTLVRLCTAASVSAMLGVAPSPEPAASDAPTPLKEIGRVRTSVCSTIVVHANSAIDDALANDSDLHNLIAALVTANMDDATELKRRNTYHDLERVASKLRETALDGEGEVRRMRALAAESPEPRKSELRAFADALGGALYRQRTIAIDTQRLLAVQQGREAKAEADAQSATDATTFNSRGGAMPRKDAPYATQPGSVDAAFRSVASDIADRTKLVTADEGVAADHSLGATTGC